MSGRVSTQLAWVLAAVAVVLLVSGAVVLLASGMGVDVGNAVFLGVMTLVFAGTGVLIAARHPGNAIGWTFLGAAVAVGLASLAGSYADY